MGTVGRGNAKLACRQSSEVPNHPLHSVVFGDSPPTNAGDRYGRPRPPRRVVWRGVGRRQNEVLTPHPGLGFERVRWTG